MIALVVFNAAVVVAAVVAVVRARRRSAALEAELEELAARSDRRRAEIIAVEISNHADVAVSRTSFAKPLASWTPGLLRTLVHQEVCSIMRAELASQGVEADVRIRRVRLPRDDAPDDGAASEE